MKTKAYARKMWQSFPHHHPVKEAMTYWRFEQIVEYIHGYTSLQEYITKDHIDLVKSYA